MKVTNMKSSRGNTVPNQFIIEYENGVMFQSYNSNIAFKPNNRNEKIRIGKHWRYSKTTSKYRNEFLRETQKETQEKIDNGTYIYDENL